MRRFQGRKYTMCEPGNYSTGGVGTGAEPADCRCGSPSHGSGSHGAMWRPPFPTPLSLSGLFLHPQPFGMVTHARSVLWLLTCFLRQSTPRGRDWNTVGPGSMSGERGHRTRRSALLFSCHTRQAIVEKSPGSMGAGPGERPRMRRRRHVTIPSSPATRGGNRERARHWGRHG